MEEKKTGFEYTYSAPTEQERKEIESIRRQYQAQPVSDREEKLNRLRKLDSFVKNSATTVALTLGLVGLLIFGLGMTMVLEWELYIWGVVVGAVGLTPIMIAYPVYNLMLNKNKEKYGEQIIMLTEELLNDKNEKKK